MYSEVKNRLAIIIIDAKVGITAYDEDMIKTLREYHVDFIIIANKVDNLKRNQKEQQLVRIRADSQDSLVLPYSSKENFGRKELMERISSFIH